jgi:hypothetical protein
MFDPNDPSSQPRLIFRPEKLRELGIPDAIIEAAAKSDPQGFLLFDDLPDQTEPATGHANQNQLTNPQPELEPGGCLCPKSRILAS